MVLIDTSAWIEYFRDGDFRIAEAVEKALEKDRVGIGDLIYCEVMQGIKPGPRRRQIGELFSSLTKFEMVGFDIASTASDNYRLLRSRGLTIRKTIDVIIGTFCAINDHELIHNDRDFDLMAPHIGLTVRSQ